MSAVRLPDRTRIENLSKQHQRKAFESGESKVDEWIKTRALQTQEKGLSSTYVLTNPDNKILAYYTLVFHQLRFDELPHDELRKLPKTDLPALLLAWLGVDRQMQRRGNGTRLLAHSLNTCLLVGSKIGIVAVLVDCINENAKAFYQNFGFRELPNRPNRLFISRAILHALSKGDRHHHG